jgi:hypothetical protein
MIPENLQNRNVRRFKGFTPQQVAQLLNSKGLKPNSREAAEYLGAMAERAEEILQNAKPMRAYQGGSVGGFDDRSRKLFDAAVRRTSSTDPKSPEVQRYLDNVIETRGKPTMVFPGTADPLQGYQEGGAVEEYKIGNPGDFPVYGGPAPTPDMPIDFPPIGDSQPMPPTMPVEPQPPIEQPPEQPTPQDPVQRDPLPDPTTSP